MIATREHWVNRAQKAEAKNTKLELIIKQLRDTLWLCDPRENYGEGLVCQFCNATTNEEHKEDCTYLCLTEGVKP